MSMTHKEMIEVIAAHEHGAQVQIKSLHNMAFQDWTNITTPLWDFASYEYRVTQPAKVKMWQWIIRTGSGAIALTNQFHADETALREAIDLHSTPIQKAKWTEIEVDAT